MTNAAAVISIIVIVALLLAIFLMLAFSPRSPWQRAKLRERFGPEYDRAVEQYGSTSRAHRELAARAKRARRFKLNRLTDAQKADFAENWARIQARFVDEPAIAVREANDLITSILAALGYPRVDFEQRVADLSVDHPNVVQHYRAAHALAQAHPEAQADTEELRQAIVHYRALFAELVERPQAPEGRRLQEVHA